MCEASHIKLLINLSHAPYKPKASSSTPGASSFSLAGIKMRNVLHAFNGRAYCHRR